MDQQTSFETGRGISAVSVEKGYSLIVTKTPDGMAGVLRAADELARRDLSYDSLKLGDGYFSFIVSEEKQKDAVAILAEAGFAASHHRSKAIVKVTAPNVRDESGLMARIAEITVGAGAIIYDVGDMNDGVLLTVQSEKADAVADLLRGYIGNVDIL
jgi:hypothetical protein